MFKYWGIILGVHTVSQSVPTLINPQMAAVKMLMSSLQKQMDDVRVAASFYYAV